MYYTDPLPLQKSTHLSPLSLTGERGNDGYDGGLQERRFFAFFGEIGM
jgi:hypothetical protein